jgi:uncharacterized membrane protein
MGHNHGGQHKLPALSSGRRNVAKDENAKLVAIVFEGEHGAEGMLATLRDLEDRDALKLKDAVVLSRGPAGETVFVGAAGVGAGPGSGASMSTKTTVAPETEVKQTTDKRGRRVLKTGGVGLLVGMLLGGPVGGMLIGGLIGAMRDKGVDNKFVNQIADGLKPDTSAVLLLVESADADQVLAEISPLKGTVIHTTLAPEMEKRLREALRD